MNYIPKIAEMLGVEIGEPFIIRYSDNCESIVVYRFGQNGLEHFALGEWVKDLSGVIDELLEGRSQIIKKPWKPRLGEPYWYYLHKVGGKSEDEAAWIVWRDCHNDYVGWKLGNCFSTRGEAETKGKEIMEQIIKEYEEQ